jgi:hypothetical protein
MKKLFYLMLFTCSALFVAAQSDKNKEAQHSISQEEIMSKLELYLTRQSDVDLPLLIQQQIKTKVDAYEEERVTAFFIVRLQERIGTLFYPRILV